MPGQIKTPTNQKLLTNVAVELYSTWDGRRFEIACYKNKVVNWRAKTEKDINEVLQTQNIFINVSKGQLAKKEDLMILEKGDLQVSDKERQVTAETSIKEIATLVANMCVDPETKRPYSSAVIEKALRDQHFNLKANRNAKQQALEAIPKLREAMSIDRAKMRVRISVPAKDAKNIHERVKSLFEAVEVEDWEKGALEMVGLVDPGNYKSLAEIVQGDKKCKGTVELLSLKVINDIEVEIS
uniref:Ribosome maturation protein SBDS n=1 Tax=Ditylenchus dipsaci TaxID=166011 RepID=A0A915EEL6_9BILA